MVVQVTEDSLDRDLDQGEISVSIINQASGSGHIGRYRGGQPGLAPDVARRQD